MPNPYISLIFSVKLSVSNLKPSIETLFQLKLMADNLIFHVDESKGLWPKAVVLKGRVVGRAGPEPMAVISRPRGKALCVSFYQNILELVLEEDEPKRVQLRQEDLFISDSEPHFYF